MDKMMMMFGWGVMIGLVGGVEWILWGMVGENMKG